MVERHIILEIVVTLKSIDRILCNMNDMLLEILEAQKEKGNGLQEAGDRLNKIEEKLNE